MLHGVTLPELGNKVPEKWEGLAIGPQLKDGSYLMLAGTDNDYSVTQNTDGDQLDVYFRVADSDPYLTSIQCPLGETIGRTGAAEDVPADGNPCSLSPGL